jgi:flagellar motor switch protein FliG
LLLASLDSGTAAELLKSAKPEQVTEIAAELAYLKTTRHPDIELTIDTVREFYTLLKKGARRGRKEDFLKKMIENAVGRERSEDVLNRVQVRVDARDPFLPIRSADAEDIAKALEGESPQVAAMVLTELPTAKSHELLALLSEEVRSGAVCGMTVAQEVPLEARLRVATVIRRRLDAFAAERAQAAERARAAGAVVEEKAPTVDHRQQQLRKVAVLLRGLGQEQRDELLNSIVEQDKDTADEVRMQMVIWEDMPIIGERSLQEALRTIDAKVLALAIMGADEGIVLRIRSNISERASAMIEEETSLISSPDPEQTEEARGTVVETLRDMNAKGELTFEES